MLQLIRAQLGRLRPERWAPVNLHLLLVVLATGLAFVWWSIDYQLMVLRDSRLQSARNEVFRDVRMKAEAGAGFNGDQAKAISFETVATPVARLAKEHQCST